MEENKSKSTTIIMFLLVLIIVLLAGFICYDKFINKSTNKEETTENNESKTTDKEESLDINSDFVKELYDLVHVNCDELSCYDYHSTEDGFKMNVKNMKEEYKAYFGYRQIPNMYLTKMEFCGLFKNIDFGYHYCGDAGNQNKSETYPATILDESVLKEYVEKIFGEGSYSSVPWFTTPTGDAYYYDNNSKYVSAGIEKGGSGPRPGYKIESASKLGDQVYIIEEGTYYTGDRYEIENTAKYKLTLKKSTSGYIFESVEKI